MKDMFQLQFVFTSIYMCNDA